MQAGLHLAAALAGCVLALVPALSAPSGLRWPHLAMALGMAAGHFGGAPGLAVAVIGLLAAGWCSGSPAQRAKNGHHVADFALMAVLLTLGAVGPSGPPAAHAHGGGLLAPVALAVAVGWTASRAARALRRRHTACLCATGMAGCMAVMAGLAL
ncbi:hypothetical protein EDD29_2233 [Actinocorallia herbida]|uniref:DUF5134 domain-containing protein n=1 Tax=Actinocorallia herbida TaxID=58109 RepID=A0A3N1CU01_9ACTN|nr:hypothetical protein [Actinocorallia herbida]ROO84705.1 hypothetical protein EDD29_2233 [Actinocorallia herbida]